MDDDAALSRNVPAVTSFKSYLHDVMLWLFLVPALTRYSRVATFAHMRLGMLWLVIRPIVLVGGVAALAASVLGDANSKSVLSSTILGLGFWYSFHRCLMLVGRAPVRLRKIALHFEAVPRVVFVLGGFGPALVEAAVIMAVSLGAYVAVTLYQHSPLLTSATNLFLLPLSIMIASLLVVSLSLIISHLVDLVRDVWYGYKYFLSFGFIATPILYSPSSLPPIYRDYLWLNPFAGAVSAFRGSILPADVDTTAITFSTGFALTALVASLFVSFRFERPAVPTHTPVIGDET